jgi:hypothetical protein
MLGAPTARPGTGPGNAIEGDIVKLSLALAGTALLAGTLTACGGSSAGGSGSEYCKDLKSASAKVGSLTNPDVSSLDDAFKAFNKLESEAPGSVKDDWNVIDDAVVAIQKAFADAGLKISDLGKIRPGSKPSGLDRSKITDLVTKLKKLNTPEFTKATDAITAHAKSTCKVTLK